MLKGKKGEKGGEKRGEILTIIIKMIKQHRHFEIHVCRCLKNSYILHSLHWFQLHEFFCRKIVKQFPPHSEVFLDIFLNWLPLLCIQSYSKINNLLAWSTYSCTSFFADVFRIIIVPWRFLAFITFLCKI